MEKPFSWIWLPVQLEGFTPDPVRTRVPAGATPFDAAFGEAVHLQAVRMPAAQQAGDPWILTFYLSRLQPEQQPYSLVLRLVDDTGTEWARLGRLLWHDYPPAAWPQDTLLRYDHVERIPAGVPPGTYQVWLRVVDEASEPLPLPGGQLELRLPDLTVAAAPCTAEPDTWLPHRPRRARFGPALTLVGSSPFPDSVRPGHRLSLEFLWCVRGQPGDDYRLRLQLLDGGGTVVAESLSPFSRAGLPATMLQPGTLIAGHADLTVPATVAADTYRLRLSLLPAEGERSLPVNWLLSGRGVTLGEVEILPWPLETAFPPIATLLQADFGVPTLIEFHGYAVEDRPLAAGKETTLTLFWRAAAPIPDNYRVFIHLAAEDDQIPAQADGFPVQGMRPTTGWRPGEVIVDEHTLSLPATLPPGTYRLWIGLYDLESDVRLPITVDGEAQTGDRLLLETVVIEP